MEQSQTTPSEEPARRSGATAGVRASAQYAYDEVWGAVFPEPPDKAKARSVLFTAAGRKEGVSTMLAGAALTGANLLASHRVALLDLNVRYPRLCRILGASDRPGLADVLAGRAELVGVAQALGAGNLMFYPGGGDEAAMTLLASEKLRELIGQIAQSHDYVLCDCAAANQFPDAQILGPLFDGVVLVAEAGATRRESLAQAKRRVELGQGRVLGVVLNKRRYPVPRFLYRRS